MKNIGKISAILSALVAMLVFAHSAQAAGTIARTDANLAAASDCAAIEQKDFKTIPGAPTAIVSSKLVAVENGVAAYCAVVGVVQPQVQFELRMPVSGWNGRYFQTGCGGLCGNVPIQNCSDAFQRGFAVAAQNMGHVGHFWRDALWASVPALREDFGRRSTHVVAVAAKAIVEHYYQARPAYSYFRGCSTGGREGLSEAQFYPEDFDGIIAGDPAFPGRQGGLANNWDAQQLLDAQEQPVFTGDKLKVLATAVMNACDGTDGLKDGIIGDPRLCRFDPETLACPKGVDKPDCLNAAQVRTALNLYQGPKNKAGVYLTPGGAPFGSELEWDGIGRRSIADAYLRFLAFDTPRPDYNYRNFDFDKDVASLEASARMFDPVPPHGAPDLSAFARRGGKLIVYHGWADPGVSPFATLDYYARVAERNNGLANVRKWFRVFMVPGMYHCRGGNAPNTFDFLPALMDWVEKGRAPDGIIATQKENDAVIRTRPLFAYPNFAKYDGTGDVNLASNWRMARPTSSPLDKRTWYWGTP